MTLLTLQAAAYWELARDEEAKAILNRSIALHEELAGLYARKGSRAKAEATYRRAIACLEQAGPMGTQKLLIAASS
jgi:tetratricopeptide (TPR) repeat protein